MRSVLVTGCNRGIGLSLIKQLLISPICRFDKVIATCRNSQGAPELLQLATAHNQLKVINIDLKDFNKYNDLAKEVATVTENNGLNLLINNAGVSTKFSRIGQLKLEQLMENFVINTAAPLMLTKALLPLLKSSATKNKDSPMGIQRAAIINISSVLGSIAANTDGGYYPYRCSKSALNAATKSLSLDLLKDNIIVVAVHPGWCKTDMGGNNAPLHVDTATGALLQTLYKLGADHNGSFIQYDGSLMKY